MELVSVTSSEERREVAERLRERPVARNINEAYVAIVQAIGVRPCLLSHEGESGDRFNAAAYAEALEKLADLIDPTCHMVWIDRVGDVNRWRCDACGCRSVERIVSDRLHDPAPAWCHRCGARVVGE